MKEKFLKWIIFFIWFILYLMFWWTLNNVSAFTLWEYQVDWTNYTLNYSLNNLDFYNNWVLERSLSWSYFDWGDIHQIGVELSLPTSSRIYIANWTNNPRIFYDDTWYFNSTLAWLYNFYIDWTTIYYVYWEWSYTWATYNNWNFWLSTVVTPPWTSTDSSVTNYIYIDSALYTISPLNYNIDIVSTWSITMLSNWVELTWVDINKDFNINYTITKYDENNIWVDVDSWSMWPFNAWVNNLQFLNNANFEFQSLWLYDLDITFIDVNDSTDTIRKIYNADYTYNEWYIDPNNINFTFFVNWYTFFENGFSLDNFIPDPSWWKLYFDIIAPDPNGTWTIDLQTNYFLPYEIDWNWYGIDSSVKITYPYHQIAWIYQVRTVYEYDWLVVYPFWTDYNSYEITVAELPANYVPDDIYICDKNWDWINDIWESIACPITILKYYTEKITDNVDRLKLFFRSIMNIWTNEIKTFSFIWTANANILDNMPAIETQDNVLSKLYYFIKWFLYLIFLLLSIILIIYLKKE